MSRSPRCGPQRTAKTNWVGPMLGALREQGVRTDDLARVCSDRAFAAGVASYVKTVVSHVDTPNQSAARAIMRDHFFGLEEVRHYCGANFGRESDALLAHVPFSEQTLHECRETHILFPGYPFSITEMYAKWQPFFSPLGNAQFDSFARDEKVDLRWYLIRRTFQPVERTFGELCVSLSCFEEVPLACEMVFMGSLCRLSKKQHLFRNVRVLCGDTMRGIDPGICHVYVQEDEHRRICFGRVSPYERTVAAIAAARKH